MADALNTAAASTDCGGEPHAWKAERGADCPVWVKSCTLCGEIDWQDLKNEVASLMAVRDEEMERLRAEVEADDKAISELNTSVTRMEKRAAGWRERAEKAEQRAVNAEERLSLARDALLRDDYFTPDQVGPDIAPRITERLSALRDERDQADGANARVRALHPSYEEADAAENALCLECAQPAPCRTRAAVLDGTPEPGRG